MSPAPATRSPFAALLLAAAFVLPGPAFGLTFEFPGPAIVAGGRSETMSSAVLPLGPWASGTLPARRVEGALEQTAWQIDAPGLTTLQILAPLRDQVRDAGYRVLFECDTRNCGGFDFRYAIDVLPEPDMHVDLGDFRFLAAERPGPGPSETVSLLVSRSARTGYAQVTLVGSAARTTIPFTSEPAPAVPDAPADGIAQRLDQTGAMALDDLTFATGAAVLAAGEFASLRSIANYLSDHPDRQVALVGHTDAAGELAGNVTLSRARAASVRDRLIRDYGAPPDRVAAEGVGYLVPRASNLTEEGRTLNRRVEVVLTSIR